MQPFIQLIQGPKASLDPSSSTINPTSAAPANILPPTVSITANST